MRYDMVARFFEHATDETPLYESPLGIYCETIQGDLEEKGFHPAKDCTPGYLDYEKDSVTEEELDEYMEEGYLSEVMDILYNDIDFERISIRAWEIEHIDDAGGIPPFGARLGKTFVRLGKTEPMSPVWFVDYGLKQKGGTPRSFRVPLKRLKDYFEVLTMYEVKSRLEEHFSGAHWTFDRLKDYFESGIDEAVDLSLRKLYGLQDSEDNPLIMRAISLGMTKGSKTRQVAGILYEVFSRGDVTLRELLRYGFSEQVCWTLVLVKSRKGKETVEDHADRIALSGNEDAMSLFGNIFGWQFDGIKDWDQGRREKASATLDELRKIFEGYL